MMKNPFDNKTKKIAIDGMMTALAIIFGYVETLIPISVGIPGIKLGLANVVVLFVLTSFEAYDALLVSIIRVIIIGILFGNVNSLAFALAGAACSLAAMYISVKTIKLNIIVASLIGAVFHIIGQLIVGLIWYPVEVLLYYGMFLLMAAVLTGIINGVIVDMAKRCIYNKLI